MMVKPTVQELLTKAKNRYELVIATSKRARQIAEGAEVKTKVKEESPVTLAANEIAEGKEKWKEMIEEFYGPFEKNLEKVEKELEHVEIEEEVSDVKCDKCGRMMVYKYGKFGKFLACPGYPECKNTKAIIETIDIPCPKCGGTVQVRKAKNKRKYYICENNPKSCDYISWNKPTKENK